MNVLPKGTKLICPDCKRTMAVAMHEVVKGVPLHASYFRKFHGVVAPGKPMECPFDGAAYGAFKVHTENGWV